jgi:hypothetical protein
MTNVIRHARSHIVSIKPLAAGRVLPPTGFNFVLSAIKPSDFMAVGFMSVDEAEEDIKLAESIIERTEQPEELTYSRSKQILTS